MLVSKIIFSFGVVGVVNALPSSERSSVSCSVKERHAVPRDWTRIGPASKRDTIHLQIGLRQQNDGIIEQKLLETSDPNHQNYGKHLSHDEVMEMITPSDETLELVQSWLHDNGIEDYTQNRAKDMIHCEIPVEKAEQLLQTSYSTYRHQDGAELVRAPEWSLPEHLHDHIDIIQPTTSFFNPRPQIVLETATPPQEDKPKDAKPQINDSGRQAGHPNVSDVCWQNVTTPQCVRTLYRTLDYVPQVPDKNGIGTCNYLNQTVIRADVKTYLQRYRPDAVNASDELAIVQVAGGDISQEPSAGDSPKLPNQEANLDAQEITAITYPTMFTAYHVGGSPPFQPDKLTPNNTNEPYLTWLDWALQQPSLPQVITTSYGDDEQTVPPSYAQRVCNSFAQLGARGITIIFATGDHGVGKNGTCFSNSMNNTDGTPVAKFVPTFPSSCPWVTTVGSVQGYTPEIATTGFASGGGFSDYFPRPKYQDDVVPAYIKTLNGLHDGLYNVSGRAYPDISAQGAKVGLVVQSKFYLTAGTSAAAPIVAGVIALVNDALIAKGKPTLGFLNPLIYGKAKGAWTDVVQGSSFGCNTTGFPTRKEWDPVTGWGTPNFKKLTELIVGRSGY